MAKFVVKHEQIFNAVKKYTDAEAKFSTAKQNYEKALSTLDWDDAAREKWNGVSQSFITELTKMEEKLHKNGILLQAMSKAAEEDQQNTIAGVGRIMS